MLGIEVFLIMIIKQQRTKNILADDHLQVTLPLTIFVYTPMHLHAYACTRRVVGARDIGPTQRCSQGSNKQQQCGSGYEYCSNLLLLPVTITRQCVHCTVHGNLIELTVGRRAYATKGLRW